MRPSRTSASQNHMSSCPVVRALERLRLLPERAALGEPRLAAGRLRQHEAHAVPAHDHGLRVAEQRADAAAAGALNVHEVAVRLLDEALELVLARRRLLRRVQEVGLAPGRRGRRGRI